MKRAIFRSLQVAGVGVSAAVLVFAIRGAVATPVVQRIYIPQPVTAVVGPGAVPGALPGAPPVTEPEVRVPALQIWPEYVLPGGQVRVVLSGFANNDRITIVTTASGVTLDSREIDADGEGINESVNEIPRIAPAGSYQLTATGASGAQASGVINITNDAALARAAAEAPQPVVARKPAAPATAPQPGAPPVAQPAPSTPPTEPEQGSQPVVAVPVSEDPGTAPGAGSPPAASRPAGQASLVLSPSVVAPGGTVTAYGSGFAPNDRVTVTTTSGGSVVNTTSITADGNGEFSSTNQIPAIAPAGTYYINARGASGASASAALTIGSGGGGAVAASPLGGGASPLGGGAAPAGGGALGGPVAAAAPAGGAAPSGGEAPAFGVGVPSGLGGLGGFGGLPGGPALGAGGQGGLPQLPIGDVGALGGLFGAR
jgi:hypothetical protein